MQQLWTALQHDGPNHLDLLLIRLQVDGGTVDALKQTGLFEVMSREVDEAEHSIELHLPFIAEIFSSQRIQIVPVLVGALSPASETTYGAVMAPFLDDPANFFVISSDFCHWSAASAGATHAARHQRDDQPLSDLSTSRLFRSAATRDSPCTAAPKR